MINFLSFRKRMATFYENHTKNINIYFGTNAEFLIIKQLLGLHVFTIML
jgi:hypothetical protein